jgi:hypothetical protein
VIGLIFRAARLAAAINGLWPAEVPPERAAGAALAIVMAADGEDEALLASIAYTESRFLPGVRNPRTGCAGPMGVRRFDITRGEFAGYRAGVAALRESRAYCIRRRTPGQLCTLAGYRSGPRGVRLRLYRGPRAVLERRDRIRRELDRLTPAARRERGGPAS